MILAIGEILFDVYPDRQHLGGAPFNFVFHLKQLGMPVTFVTRIGDDAAGKEILGVLEEYNFNTAHVQVDSKKSTGKVLVELDKDKTPHFNILSDVAYDNIEFDPSLDTLLLNDVQLIYFGTLVQRTPNGFATIQKILSRKGPETKCLYDVNLRPDCYSEKIVIESLKNTDILKLNKDELNFIRKIVVDKKDKPNFIQNLLEEYKIEIIAITKGKKGSALISDAGSFQIKANQNESVIDTVGAGDAYAAMLALGHLKNWPISRTLSLAHQFAARMCTIKGALPEHTEIYRKIIQMMEG
ncbi:carbohydrate kinase [Thermodesulfobacteriota bacterium]